MNTKKKKMGRPRLPDNERRKAILIRLPPDIIKKLNRLSGSKTGLIEKALRKTYNIKGV